jgi:DNA modification methylase
MTRNTLNDLEPREWLKFQKSWFVHNPPPRIKGVLQHPAKFPETLAEEFIRFFTNEGDNTLLKKFAGVFAHNADIERLEALVC